MDKNRFLAFDLGAESGRAVVGTLAEDRLRLQEIHRFPNNPVELGDTLYWNFLDLYMEVQEGLRIYSGRFGASVAGIGIDSWGVDFGLLAADGSLLQNPVHYRDRRTEDILEQIKERMSPQRLFELSGMTPSPIYTLVQLFSMRLGESPILGSATKFLMIPDLFAYFLTGIMSCERTVAVSTQLYDPRGEDWQDEILATFDLNRSITPKLVHPGSILGKIRPSIGEQTGLEESVVIAPCSHDTASAVAAVPAVGDDWAFLSSGTWSVLGALSEEPITTKEAFSAGLCNELTLGSFFLCRNIMGLWLLQQARDGWRRSGKAYSYSDLIEMAESAADDGPLINPDDPRFLAPKEMNLAIVDYWAETGQECPHSPAEIARCIIESLALCYRQGLEKLGQILGRRFRVIHLVGGGALNTLLCQFTADATGIPVLAGPVEATVSGNVLVQALGRGYLSSPQEIRDVVRTSFEPIEYEPHNSSRWDEVYDRYLRLVEHRAN